MRGFFLFILCSVFLMPLIGYSAETCPKLQVKLRPKSKGGKAPILDFPEFWSIHSGPIQEVLLKDSQVSRQDRLRVFFVPKKGERSKAQALSIQRIAGAYKIKDFNMNDFIEDHTSLWPGKLVLEFVRKTKVYCKKVVEVRGGD